MMCMFIVVSLLLCLASSLVNAQNGASTEEIVIAITPGIAGAMQDWTQQYSLLNPSVSFSTPQSTASKILGLLSQPTISSAISSSPIPKNYGLLQNAANIPALAAPVVIAFNLPGFLPGNSAAQLVISTEIFGAMCVGAITMWNDPKIVALNPNFASVLPAQKISEVIVRGTDLAYSGPIAYALATESPTFIAALKAAGHNNTIAWATSATLVWPGRIVKIIPGVTLFDGQVIDLALAPYGITYCFNTDAEFFGLQVANSINVAGNVVQPTAESMYYAMGDVLALPYANNGIAINMIGVSAATAWPYGCVWYLQYSKTLPRTTCSEMTATAKFWLWFFTNSVPTAIGAARNVQILSPTMVTDQGIVSLFTTQMTCSGALVLPASIATSTYEASGSYMLSQYVNSQIQFILGGASATAATSTAATSGNTPTLTYAPNSSDNALQQVLSGESPFGLIIPQIMQQNLLADAISQNGALLFPMAAISVAVIHSLTLTGSTTPLVLDVTALGNIITGQILKWNDPQIQALNPQLASANLLPNANITVFLSSTTNPQQRDIEAFFIQALANVAGSAFNYTTPLDQAAPLFSQLPFWTTRPHLSQVTNQNLADIALQFTATALPPLANAIAFMVDNPSIVSQRVALQVGTNIIQSGALATSACLNGVPSQWYATMPLDYNLIKQTSRPDLCWPLSSLIYSVALQTYAAPCVAATNFLPFLESLQIQSGSAALVNYHIAYISPVLQNSISAEFNTLTCDGETILITLPLEVRISSSYSIGSLAMMIVTLTLCCLSGAFVYLFKGRREIRSAVPWFLFVQLTGLAQLSICVFLLFQQTATNTSCSASFWIGHIGFYLTFSSVIAKQWRIWRIFFKSQMQVLKITDLGLTLRILIVWIIPFCLLTAMQVFNPLVATQSLQSNYPRDNLFFYCAPQSNNMAFIITLLAVYSPFIFFAIHMAASTGSDVKDFAESQVIALMIYNLFATCAIGIAVAWVLAFNPVNVMAVVGVAILYLTCTTYAMSLPPKMIRIWKSTKEGYIPDRKTDSRGSNSQASGSTSAGAAGNSHDRASGGPGKFRDLKDFFGTTIRLLDKNNLRKYVSLLDKELVAAKNHLQSLIANDHIMAPSPPQPVSHVIAPASKYQSSNSPIAPKNAIVRIPVRSDSPKPRSPVHLPGSIMTSSPIPSASSSTSFFAESKHHNFHDASRRFTSQSNGGNGTPTGVKFKVPITGGTSAAQEESKGLRSAFTSQPGNATTMNPVNHPAKSDATAFTFAAPTATSSPSITPAAPVPNIPNTNVSLPMESISETAVIV